MSNTFTAGTLLVDKETKLGYLVEQTFTMTKLIEYRQLREVGNLQIKAVKLDLARLSEQYDIVQPDGS